MKTTFILLTVLSISFIACKKSDSASDQQTAIGKLSLTGTKWTKYGVDTTTFTADTMHYIGNGEAMYHYTLIDSIFSYANIRMYQNGKWVLVTPVVYNTGKVIFVKDSFEVWYNYNKPTEVKSLTIIGIKIK